MRLWAIQEKCGDKIILHFTIDSTRSGAWDKLFTLSSYRDDPAAQRRGKRLFKAVKVKIVVIESKGGASE